MKAAKLLAMVLCLVMTIGSIGFAGEARGEHGKRGFPLLKMLKNLDLTDEQKNHVYTVISSHRDEMKSKRAELWEAREALAAVIHETAFDEEKIRRTHQKAAALMEDMTVLRARIFSEIKPVLTEDQLEKIREFIEERKEKMKDRMDQGREKAEDWLQQGSDG